MPYQETPTKENLVEITMDHDGDIRVIDESQLRQIAKRNKILDFDTLPLEDIADCLEQCFENEYLTFKFH